jgi:hypothetical protein
MGGRESSVYLVCGVCGTSISSFINRVHADCAVERICDGKGAVTEPSRITAGELTLDVINLPAGLYKQIVYNHVRSDE